MVQGRLPDFVIVGTMRSGSTSLFRYLADHPSVFMAQPKEVHFFDEQYVRGLDWYKSKFAAARPDQRVGEATPFYLSSAAAIERLARDVPDVQAIAILRDPVDRAYSQYWLRHALGREPREWAEVAAQDLRSTEPLSVFWSSRYSIHLARLFVVIARSRCLVLSFDDLVSIPDKFFATVCEFIGVDPIASSATGVTNAAFDVRSRLLRRLTMHRLVPRPVRKAVARVNQVERGYPPMEPEIRATLDVFFEPDRQVLEQATAANTQPQRPRPIA